MPSVENEWADRNTPEEIKGLAHAVKVQVTEELRRTLAELRIAAEHYRANPSTPDEILEGLDRAAALEARWYGAGVVDEQRLRENPAAEIWAEEFIKQFSGGPCPDKGTMVGWFANAIQVARTHERTKPRSAAPTVEEIAGTPVEPPRKFGQFAPHGSGPTGQQEDPPDNLHDQPRRADGPVFSGTPE
jgi:hypothetical protein